MISNCFVVVVLFWQSLKLIMLFSKELFSGDTVALDFCCDKDEEDDDEVLWRVIKLSKLDISSSEFAVVVVVIVGVVFDDDIN